MERLNFPNGSLLVVSYADVVLVTFLHFLKRAGEGLFEKWVAHDDEFLRIYEASKQWLDKED